MIEQRMVEFYVNEANVRATVVVDRHGDNKYIRTTADRVFENNLLLLPECPT